MTQTLGQVLLDAMPNGDCVTNDEAQAAAEAVADHAVRGWIQLQWNTKAPDLHQAVIEAARALVIAQRSAANESSVAVAEWRLTETVDALDGLENTNERETEDG